MSPLSILHVDPERGFSGGETQVLALMIHLREWGHRVWLACEPDAPLWRRASAADLGTLPLRCSRSHDPFAGVALRALVRQTGADVVHLHTARALSLAPYLPRRQRSVVTRRMDYAPRGGRRYVRWLYGRVDAILAISGPVRKALVDAGVDGPIDIVRSGVDLARFAAHVDAEAARRALAIPPDRPTVAIVAALHARKGHATLFRALARLALDRIRPICLVAGEGPEAAGLSSLAEDLGLTRQVRWLGEVGDVRPLLAAADVVAMPSLAEGLGIAAVEAMAAGRPVVASAVGGLAELVRDGIDGILVPPRDDVELAGALRRLLEAPALRERIGAAAAQRAGEYSTQAMAAGTEAVYERLLGRRVRSRSGASPALDDPPPSTN